MRQRRSSCCRAPRRVERLSNRHLTESLTAGLATPTDPAGWQIAARDPESASAWCASARCASARRASGAGDEVRACREARHVVLGVAEHRLERAHPLEVEADVVLVGDADAAVELDRLLGD